MSRKTQCLKCLSALGFWGARNSPHCSLEPSPSSQMPFGFGVLGSYTTGINTLGTCGSLKCLSALGFWGALKMTSNPSLRLVSNAFRLWGFGEPIRGSKKPTTTSGSQMPFGFGVLGSGRHRWRSHPRWTLVSNAFRLWGFGEQFGNRKANSMKKQVSNAFRLWGFGELELCHLSRWHDGCLKCLSALGFWGAGTLIENISQLTGKSQMPFGFGVLGSPRPRPRARARTASLKCLSALGFWGAVRLYSIGGEESNPMF